MSRDHFDPPRKKRVDADLLSASGALTSNLKARNVHLDIELALRKSFGVPSSSLLLNPPETSLAADLSYSADSESTAIDGAHRAIERALRTRHRVPPTSNELPAKTSAPLQTPASASTIKIQDHNTPVMSPALDFHGENLFLGFHSTSLSLERKRLLDTRVVKEEPGASHEKVEIPEIFISESAVIEDAEPNLGSNKKSYDRQSLDTEDAQSSSGELGTAIGEAKSAHTNKAVNHPHVLKREDLARKLGIDLIVTAPKCHGSKETDGMRCGNPISKPNWKHVRHYLDRLVKVDLFCDSKERAEDLLKLACLINCQRYHQDQAIILKESWEKLLSGTVQSIKRSRSLDGDVQSHSSTTSADSIATARYDLEAKSVSKRSTKYRDDSDFSPGSKSNADTIIRTLVAYDLKLRDTADIMNLFKGIISKDLTPVDIRQRGFLYIYWFPANFGLIKIGRSSGAVERRLKEWERQCGHKPILLFPKTSEDIEPVSHTHRLEAIVHAEFRQYRMKEPKCKGCHKTHKEWFVRPFSVAVAAVRKWSTWMRQEPYEPTGQLKHVHKLDLQNLAKIVPDAKGRSPLPRSRLGSRRPRPDRLDSRFRSRSEQPRRRSSRLADKRRLSSQGV